MTRLRLIISLVCSELRLRQPPRCLSGISGSRSFADMKRTGKSLYSLPVKTTPVPFFLEQESRAQLDPPRAVRVAVQPAKRVRVGQCVRRVIEARLRPDSGPLIGVEGVVEFHAQLQPPRASDRNVPEQ